MPTVSLVLFPGYFPASVGVTYDDVYVQAIAWLMSHCVQREVNSSASFTHLIGEGL